MRQDFRRLNQFVRCISGLLSPTAKSVGLIGNRGYRNAVQTETLDYRGISNVRRRDFISQTTYKRRQKHVKSLLPIVSIGVNGRCYFTSGAERRSSFIIRAIFLNLPFCRFIAPINARLFAHARVIRIRLDMICDEIVPRRILIRERTAMKKSMESLVHEDAMKPLSEIPHGLSISFSSFNENIPLRSLFEYGD